MQDTVETASRRAAAATKPARSPSRPRRPCRTFGCSSSSMATASACSTARATSCHGGAQGVYYRDTRHLSHFTLAIDRAPPLLLSSSLRDDNATLTCDLTNPDLHDGEGRLDAGARSHPYPAHPVSVEDGLLRAGQRAQFRRPAAPHRDRHRVCGRFRRSVRGPRLSPDASRRRFIRRRVGSRASS